jgi:hypothetical protein
VLDVPRPLAREVDEPVDPLTPITVKTAVDDQVYYLQEHASEFPACSQQTYLAATPISPSLLRSSATSVRSRRRS